MSFITKDISFIKQHEIYNISDDGFISVNDLVKIHKRNFLIVFPDFLFNFCIKISFLKKPLKKLFGNFALDNSKLKSEMDVTLTSTKDALSSINQ